MDIALIGYGKMGQAIEQAAMNRGHRIVLRVTTANKTELDGDTLKKADVAIEFTRPESAKDNVEKALQAGVPVVCGTTGWNEELADIQEIVNGNGFSFLHASNFSIGVNIFFEINKVLARLMKGHSEYKVQVEETHHIHKKDAPSGTAITIAQQIMDNLTTKKVWVLGDQHREEALPIIAHRMDDVPGTHNVKYSSSIDDIEIIHTAHNREGFALGAVLAAEYIADKKGVFSMKDVLGIR